MSEMMMVTMPAEIMTGDGDDFYHMMGSTEKPSYDICILYQNVFQSNLHV